MRGNTLENVTFFKSFLKKKPWIPSCILQMAVKTESLFSQTHTNRTHRTPQVRLSSVDTKLTSPDAAVKREMLIFSCRKPPPRRRRGYLHIIQRVKASMRGCQNRPSSDQPGRRVSGSVSAIAYRRLGRQNSLRRLRHQN